MRMGWLAVKFISEKGAYDEIIVICSVLRLRRNTHWQQNVSFDSLLSLGRLGKGCIFRDTTTRRLPYSANAGSSTRAGTLLPGTDLTPDKIILEPF